ncbi:MAG TPA: response regulator transcription factor [Ignavibacteria bacterium]|nr:response regulator transcription factor [Ignavibacteria bacterium]
MKKLKVLIADDHKMFRQGVMNILNDTGEVEVTEAESGDELIEKLKTEKPDVILMDINMPGINGIEATKLVKKKYPAIKVMAVSTSDEENYIIEMLKAGAMGYVLKSTGVDELLEAIKVVSRGDSYFCKEASNVILFQLDKIKKSRTQKQETDVPLTDREIEVLKLIAEGLTNKEIGERLFISTRTVDTHRRNLHQKLNIKNAAGLVNYAIKNKLLDS